VRQPRTARLSRLLARSGPAVVCAGESHPLRPYWEYLCFLFRRLDAVSENVRPLGRGWAGREQPGGFAGHVAGRHVRRMPAPPRDCRHVCACGCGPQERLEASYRDYLQVTYRLL
jgi:hypothetical protein